MHFLIGKDYGNQQIYISFWGCFEKVHMAKPMRHNKQCPMTYQLPEIAGTNHAGTSSGIGFAAILLQ